MEPDFSERLKNYRRAKAMTQQDLADQLGVSNKTVSRWESGGGYPDVPLLVPLARALGVTVDDLLDAILTLKENREKRKAGEAAGGTRGGKYGFDAAAHHALARKAASESIILLKNDAVQEPLLPLKENCRVALIGDFAVTPRYQGAGSSVVNAINIESMEQLAGDYPIVVTGCAPGYRRSGKADEALVKAALDLAREAELVIFCFGLDEVSETEGMDRRHMRIPQNQIDLLELLVKVNPNIVGVLSAGSLALLLQGDCPRISGRRGGGRRHVRCADRKGQSLRKAE